MADPVVQRYAQILSLASGAVPPTSADWALSPQTLQSHIDAAKADGSVLTKLSTHIANSTTLTAAQALRAIQSAGATDTTADATKVSAAATGAAATSGYPVDVKLSDPVMLDWPYRVAYAGVFAVTLLLAVIFAFVLAHGNGITASWPYVGLAVLGAVSFLGILVLVMGYKNVEINTSPSSSNGSGSSSPT